MAEFNYKSLSLDEIRAIEAEAHRLRAKAAAEMFRSLFRALRKAAAPRRARPLHA